MLFVWNKIWQLEVVLIYVPKWLLLHMVNTLAKSKACIRPVWGAWADTNAALAAGPAIKWLTLELGITQLAQLEHRVSHSRHLPISLSLFLTIFSWSTKCFMVKVQQVWNTEPAYHYLLPAVPRAPANYSTRPQQLLQYSYRATTSVTETKQTGARRNKGMNTRKRETTLGISISSSKALSWKRTEGLRG